MALPLALPDWCAAREAGNPASDKAKLLVGQARGIIDRDARRLLEAEERRKQKCQTLSLPPLRNSIGMKLKLVPAGSFTMGQAGDLSGGTPHLMTLKKPFYIGVYEVTNAQWTQVMLSWPSTWGEYDDTPVQNVSWDDAMEFCRNLSELPEERQAGRVYRLPTEAEWEYACRAGTNTKYSFGDDESRLAEYAWYQDNSNGQPHFVGKKKPNAWGLFDMHGNVWEWCSNCYSEYKGDAKMDPRGPSGAPSRVIRGGGWFNTAGDCQSAHRLRAVTSFKLGFLGFRVALSPSGVQPVLPEAATGK
jgi:formylglycine-generating enzyme required for sulfatase activity